MGRPLNFAAFCAPSVHSKALVVGTIVCGVLDVDLVLRELLVAMAVASLALEPVEHLRVTRAAYCITQ